MMNSRENLIRAWRRQGPAWTPVTYAVSPSCWFHYDPKELEALILQHPRLFPHAKPGTMGPDHVSLVPWQKTEVEYVDSWGCGWVTGQEGLTGAVHRHALATWEGFEGYQPPDPALCSHMAPIDWQGLEKEVEGMRAKGEAVCLGLDHGHTFLRLQDLRGYENFLMDMLEEAAELPRLVEMVTQFNLGLLDRILPMQPDVVTIPEDLGMQDKPMISPDLFRRFILPAYHRYVERVRRTGALLHMHSDGYILDLVDDIVACGCDVINLQDLANGIDEIARRLKGRVSIDLDVDRQAVTVHGSPAEVRDLIREEVAKLGSPEGGLSFIYGLYPPTPLANAAAVMDAFEELLG